MYRISSICGMGSVGIQACMTQSALIQDRFGVYMVMQQCRPMIKKTLPLMGIQIGILILRPLNGGGLRKQSRSLVGACAMATFSDKGKGLTCLFRV